MAGEGKRQLKGRYRYGGWVDPLGRGTYRSKGYWYKTELAGWSRGKGRKVSSSDYGKAERAITRDWKSKRAARSRSYGDVQRGHGKKGR